VSYYQRLVQLHNSLVQTVLITARPGISYKVLKDVRRGLLTKMPDADHRPISIAYVEHLNTRGAASSIEVSITVGRPQPMQFVKSLAHLCECGLSVSLHIETTDGVFARSKHQRVVIDILHRSDQLIAVKLVY